MTATLAAGLALLAAAAILGTAIPLQAPARVARLTGPLPFLLAAAGSACLAAAGAGVLAGYQARLGFGSLLGFGATVLSADQLSALFLLIAFGAAVPVCLTASRSGQPAPRQARLGAACALALLSVAVVMTSTGVFELLFGWEGLTIAFYLLAGFHREQPRRPSAGLVTLVAGKVSGAFLLVALLLLAAQAHSFTLASFAHTPGGATRTTAYALLLGAFGLKAGLVPLQIWLPRAYAAAPAPARAVMAGVAVNAGFYGLWRTFALLGHPPGWLTGILLVLAALTALLGIAHAAVQTSLARVIAYSSVENAGLITAGFGVALTGAATHDQRLAAAGMLAATLQVIAHAIAKSLLFASGAGVEASGGSDDLDQLHGAARRAPWSATTFAAGALTLAGLPLTAGFVSEWFLLESLMQQFRIPGLGYRLILAITGAAVALTVGFAAVTFVRLTGLVVLGPPGHPTVSASGPEHSWPARAGMAALAFACLALAAVTPLEIRVIGAGLAPIVPAHVTAGALARPWVLGPVFSGFSVLSPTWLWIIMPALLVIVAALTLAAAGRRMLRVRWVPVWRSASAGVEGASSYTAFGYANPTRRVLASILLTRADLHRLQQPADPSGEPGAPLIPHLGYTSDVVELVEAYLYRPMARPVRAVACAARRLQSGRLDAYLTYMLIALVAVLALVTALS